MLLRQLFDLQTGTYTYLLADMGAGEAVIQPKCTFQSRAKFSPCRKTAFYTLGMTIKG